MDYPDYAAQRIEQMDALTSTLQAATGAADARTVTLTQQQLDTLLNLVSGEQFSTERSLKNHLQRAEFVRKLQAGEPLSEAQ